MGGSKVDSAFYFSEIDQGSSWGTLCGKSKLSPRIGCILGAIKF